MLLDEVDMRILDCSVLASVSPFGVLTTSPRMQRNKLLRLIKVMHLQASHFSGIFRSHLQSTAVPSTKRARMYLK